MEIIAIIIIVLAIVFFFFSEKNSSDETPGITKAYNTLNKLPTNKKIVIEKSINDLVYIVKNNVKYLPSDVLSLEYSKNTINAFIWYYVMTLYIKRFEQEQCFMILAIVLDKLDKEKIISNLDFNARIFNDDRFKAMRTFIDVSNILPLKDNTIILVYIEQYMERITGKKVRYMNQNLNNTEERKVTTINGIEVSKENDLNILDRPDNTQEYWKVREEVGVFLQNRFKQHNGFKWIRTEPMSPKFDDMSFAYKNKIFSVLIDIKYSDKDRLSKIEKDRFINECKSNNLIPCIFPINDKKSLSLLSNEHWNLYDIRTNELVNPLTVATDEKIMMSNYEFNNMAVDIVKNYIRKENMNIESYCDIIGIFPQIWFKDKNNEMSWIYVTYSITGKFDDINIEVNKLIKGMPKYNGYIAQVGLTSVENEGPYRGAGFYVKFNGIEKVYSAHRNTEHEYKILNEHNKCLQKEVTPKKFEELSLVMKKYFQNQNHDIQYFFSLFPLLEIEKGYTLTSFVSDNGDVCPYIKEENEIYSEEELEQIAHRNSIDKNVSFTKNMDKITYDKDNPDACFELLVFNYYVSLFFFARSLYGGKIIMNEQDKISISKRCEHQLCYSLEEKQKILNTEIPRKIIYNTDGTISISMITTDASYEMLLSDYKITSNNEIHRVNNNFIVKYKILF